MKKFFKMLFKNNWATYKALNDYMRAELLVIFLHAVLGGGLTIILGKVQGIVFLGKTMAVLMVFNKIVSYLVHPIKDMKTSNKYLIILILDVMVFTLLLSYNFMITKYWLYSLIGVYAVEGVFIRSFFIDYDTVMKETVDEVMFENIRYFEQFMLTTAGIIGGVLSYILFLLFMNPTDPKDINNAYILFSMYGLGFMLVVFLTFRQYNLYYKDLVVKHKKKKDDKDKDKDKFEVGEILYSLEEYKKLK